MGYLLEIILIFSFFIKKWEYNLSTNDAKADQTGFQSFGDSHGLNFRRDDSFNCDEDGSSMELFFLDKTRFSG